METTKRKYKKHKQGYTVSVKYHLRKEKNFFDLFSPDSADAEPKFPLYIQVTFLAQTVKIRSRLMVSLTEGTFDEYMALPYVREFVENETTAIRYSITELKPETITDFRMSQWTSYYNALNEELLECVRYVIMDRLKQGIIDEIGTECDLSRLEKGLYSIAVSGLEGLQILAALKVKPALSLYNKFQPIFDILSPQDSKYRDSGDKPIYSFLDWKLGTYQKTIINKYGHKSMQLLQLLDEVMPEYEIFE